MSNARDRGLDGKLGDSFEGLPDAGFDSYHSLTMPCVVKVESPVWNNIYMADKAYFLLPTLSCPPKTTSTHYHQPLSHAFLGNFSKALLSFFSATR